MSKPDNPYASTYKSFLDQTLDHELTEVLRDDGLYRHLRIQEPGTRMWSWDITTWPGHLATSGDIADGFMFTRTSDMLNFFSLPARNLDYFSDGAPCIDFRYWAEKLCGGRSHDVREYRREIFLRQVREHLEENEDFGTQAQTLRDRQISMLERIYRARHRTTAEETSASVAQHLATHARGEFTLAQLFSMDGLSQADMDSIADEFDHDADTGRSVDLDTYCLENTPISVQSPDERRAEILDDVAWSADDEHAAHTWLADNESFVGSDTFEWDLRDWDTSFLFACYCIELTTRLYHEHALQSQIAG